MSKVQTQQTSTMPHQILTTPKPQPNTRNPPSIATVVRADQDLGSITGKLPLDQDSSA
uniref:Uncharacterized protein n=1 Tax=Arundo donax TaxID=35708 RepID=A0A0A9H6I3_ARUDO